MRSMAKNFKSMFISVFWITVLILIFSVLLVYFATIAIALIVISAVSGLYLYVKGRFFADKSVRSSYEVCYTDQICEETTSISKTEMIEEAVLVEDEQDS